MLNRRALIMEELALTPVWVRRELLVTEPQTETEPLPPAPEPATVPGQEPNARHPLSSVARTANKVIAPLVETGEAPHSHKQPQIDETPSAAPETVQEDARTTTIATMDWDALQASVSQCTACALCNDRTQTVFGVGNPQADLVVVGEAPGEEEDRLGEPFVGRAGKLLDNMLAAIREKRGERVFIANVLKCRPPGNRNPQPEEVALCSPYLLRQLQLIAPKVILASGRFAAHSLLQTQAPLSALRGKVHDWHGIPVIVTYHPAYLLRNLPDKNRAWDDLLLLRNILDKHR
ncbi:DNA polymerase [Formivibrio citricus]|uniref:Type-4 uracil-DNA glycosylase n=1 Tax=Formivibrio citricus TaxID=83765 RepID=A0A1I4WLP1_9NEIS|nr:uracil-DNA glycosylase [Formivibrio citricus]SFN14070.1 DNA polymerase [Formivibrio citricus]